MNVFLNEVEMAEVYKQAPATKGSGGFQSLLVGLQEACDRETGALTLTMKQRLRIRKYAFKYGIGGWEDRLTAAFGRHLGPRLDFELGPPEW